MTIRELLKDHPLENQLLKSAIDFDFDVDEEYPDNLTLVDFDNYPESEIEDLYEDEEYLECNLGEKYPLMYNIKYPEKKLDVLTKNWR